MGIVLNWSSSYPVTVDMIGTNFPAVSDGVHEVLASHVNTIAQVVVNLENIVGGLRNAPIQDPLSISSGQTLIWSDANSQFEPGSAGGSADVQFSIAGATRSVQTTSDAEMIVGGFTLDPSLFSGTYTVLFELYGLLQATGGSALLKMRLYDMGSPDSPESGTVRASLTIPNGDKGSNSQKKLVLNPVATPTLLDEIYNADRMYELRLVLESGSVGDYAVNMWSGITVSSSGGISQGIPQDLGAIMWWRGDDYDGTLWTDKIGSYVADGTGHAPGTALINGRQVLDFDGTSHYLDLSASGAPIDGTFRAADHTIVVVTDDPITAFGDTVIQVYNSSDDLQREYWQTWGDQMRHRRQDGAGNISNKESTDNSDNTGYHTRALSYTHSSTTVDFYLDGAADGSEVHTQSPSSVLDTGLIGATTLSLAPIQFWTGYIAELIVFPTALSAGAIAILESYFNDRYVP